MVEAESILESVNGPANLR